ncbi:MAG TPA: hypothetical protein ACFYED_10120 [Candidatus Tripitaka californicus]|uniref:hypothetical protein n=1 Tax=Candidatus Tripitaka californicus TaxID=3367616 RepID=UPI004029578F|nr:hypothetical protein [Planctomycetota bacterium]
MTTNRLEQYPVTYEHHEVYGEPYLVVDKLLDKKRYRYCSFPVTHPVYKGIVTTAKKWKEGKITQEEALLELEFLALPFERWLFEIIRDMGNDPTHLKNVVFDDAHKEVQYIAFVQHGEERYYNIRYR